MTNNCIDPHNPRIFAETVATIVLAHEGAPRCGRHEISFEALQAVNHRWLNYPEVGRSCLTHMDLAKINLALSYLTTGLYVAGRTTAGNLIMDWIPVDDY